MQPHGLNVVMNEEILEDGKVISSYSDKSVFEAWIAITNKKTNKYIELPMRSFVSGFIDKLRALLAGTANTYRSSVSCATVGASTAIRQGLVLGTGNTPVVLSDTALDAIASNANLAYGNTTFVAPYVALGTPTSPIILQSEVRRMFSNNSAGTYYINEVGLFGKTASNASGASNAHNTMYSRDIVYEDWDAAYVGPMRAINAIPFVADTDMRIDFKFKIQLSSTGGLTLNFMKLIYNLFFKANPMNSDSKIIDDTGTNRTYTYAANFPSTAGAASAAFCNIAGAATEFKGIFIAEEREAIDYINGDNYKLTEWPGCYTADEYTCSATTVSAVSGGKFTVTRTFTNNSTSNKTVTKIGILGRGNTGGAMTALPSTGGQFYMALNTPSSTTVLQPSQTYRVTYTFSI